jgi:hypothetical protein
LKLPQLLSQFLYQNRKLDLPGIGTFSLDAATVIPQESDRMSHVPVSGIQFQNANIPAADDTLINFIKEHTGKMKSLAAADLDFYLTTGRQLLNIGKAFYLEGIGTLVKNKDGRFTFTPGEFLVTKLEDLHHPDKKTGAAAMGYDEPPREEPRNNNTRQTLLLVGIVAGIAIIALGGYYLYKRNNYEPTTENQARVIPETAATRAGDTSALAAGAKPNDSTAAGKKDTTTATIPATTTTATGTPAAGTPAGAAGTAGNGQSSQHEVMAGAGEKLYHFVILRTENKNRALRRYNQLLGYQLNIHLETRDSSFFKLYFPIAATIRDTTHIRDSLADVYAAKISIEQH